MKGNHFIEYILHIRPSSVLDKWCLHFVFLLTWDIEIIIQIFFL